MKKNILITFIPALLAGFALFYFIPLYTDISILYAIPLSIIATLVILVVIWNQIEKNK